MLKYYLRDAAEGIRRNAGAALACVLILIVTLSLTGVFLLAKTGVDDILSYLERHVNIKVFVDPEIDVQEVALLLEQNSYIHSVQVEKKEETLNQLKSFFQGREHLFQAFQESPIPDAIILELKNSEDVMQLATELNNISGITDVIYAQEFAQTVISWGAIAKQYGAVILAGFAFMSFFMVSLAMNLAIYQRQKEIRVKILLGGKEGHVRGQFLFEGVILGLFGGILSSFVVYFIYQMMFTTLAKQLPMIFRFDQTILNQMMVILILFGIFIGLLGSYLSTRKLLKDA